MATYTANGPYLVAGRWRVDVYRDGRYAFSGEYETQEEAQAFADSWVGEIEPRAAPRPDLE